MFKAILFDFGGVIYKHPKKLTEEVFARVYKQPVEIIVEEFKKYHDDYFTGKLTTEKLITSLSFAFKSKKSIEQIKELYLKYYSQIAKPNKEVLDIIKNLRNHCKVYLFSNTMEINNIHNSKTGLYNHFDGLFFSYRMGMKKPNQEIYDKVIRLIGFKPEECVFVDDDVKNLVPAENMGIKTILFNVLTESPLILKEKLQKLQVC